MKIPGVVISKKQERPILALNMIVRNEAENLQDILPPIAHFFDEVVIVDTGCTDNSKEVVESCIKQADRLRKEEGEPPIQLVWVEDPWHKDFSRPRNVAIQNTTAYLIFVLDADHRILRQDMKRVRKRALDAVTNNTWEKGTYIFPMVDMDVTPFPRDIKPLLLMFPNRPSIKWESRIHETLSASVSRLGDVVLYKVNDIPIRHLGYTTPQAVVQKSLRNRELVQAEYEENPNKITLLYYLIRGYLNEGDLEGVQRWTNELFEVLKKDEYEDTSTGSLMYSRDQNALDLEKYAYEALITTLTKGEEGKCYEALALANEGLSKWPDDTRFCFFRGVVYLNLRKLKEAEQDLLICLEQGFKPQRYDVSTASRMFDTLRFLGDIAALQGDDEKRDRCREEALKQLPKPARRFIHFEDNLPAKGTNRINQREFLKGVENTPNQAKSISTQ